MGEGEVNITILTGLLNSEIDTYFNLDFRRPLAKFSWLRPFQDVEMWII